MGPETGGFLVQVDRLLAGTPPEVRSEVMAEARRQIQEGVTPTSAFDWTNRFLVSHGHTPIAKPKTSSQFKWFLAVLGIMVGLPASCIGVLVWKFTPIMQVDQASNKVKFFGGYVEIDGKVGSVKVGHQILPQQRSSLSGDAAVKGERTTRIELKFRMGQMTVSTSADSQFRWKCDVTGITGTPMVNQTDRVLAIDLSGLFVKQCSFEIPSSVQRLDLEGGFGQVVLDGPSFAYQVKLVSGAVRIHPDAAANYRYLLAVKAGSLDRFSSSTAKTAYEAHVSVDNGVIQKF